MNIAISSSRREIDALISVWSRRIFRDRALCGRIHPTDDGWVAENSAGWVIGTFGNEKRAVSALLDAAARRS
jgi:hypothetical protein